MRRISASKANHLIAIVAALVVLLLLAACGGESESDAATSEQGVAPTSEAEAPPTQASEDSGEGGERSSTAGDTTRLVQLFVDPPTLDPHLTTDATSARIILEVFGGLVTIDRNLDIVPDLAESWGVTEDGRVYTFHSVPTQSFTTANP